MSYSLSILDKSPVAEGATPAEALRHTIALAKRADELGYRRFWLAEHHGAEMLASSAPEIVAAHILAHTKRIRVGCGGVMLQHYSPYKVAEVFKTLAALAPGRVDLGVGKAPGGLPYSTRALQQRPDDADFETRLIELEACLEGALPEGHALAGLLATPVPPEPPQRILLGGGPASAALAERRGWLFAYAGHFNGDPETLARSLEAYGRIAGRPAMLAIQAFAAETQEKAERRIGAQSLYKVRFADGRSVNLPSLDLAAEFARQAGLSEQDYRAEEIRPLFVFGAPDRVRRELDALADRYGVNEFILDTPIADFDERLVSIELIAGAFSTSPETA
ncbi:LLM class flavin-dependent oxidoreductase [Methylosinus sp. H3A]|uniref:LLM class flavin-dependent oxidoreductase n=1 Tax=Methylosinus sp. H3A TaxID=2785786 RepID=UPI0018C21021|nr:LLM class flavin-dependent oxidoreductase [Methylosinus sp. H3A]MBG0808264.1 LLM class flavin-dependent oxidoreductase [Methylosinus sp. H3A]